MNLPSVINESSLTYEQPSNAIFLKSRRFEDIKYDTERGLHGDYLATTWRPLGDHLATTWRPLGNHLATTWWLLGDYLVTTWRLLGDYLVTTWRPLGDHWAFEEPTGPSEHSAGQYWPSGDPIGPFGLRLIWAIYRYLGRVLSIFGATFINFYAVELGELF